MKFRALVVAAVMAASIVPVSAKQYVVSEIKGNDGLSVTYKYNRDGTIKSYVSDTGWQEKVSFAYKNGRVTERRDSIGKTSYEYRKGKVYKSKDSNRTCTYVYKKNRLVIKSVSKSKIRAEEYLSLKNGRLASHNDMKYSYDKKGYPAKVKGAASSVVYKNTYKNGRLVKIKANIKNYTSFKRTYTIKYKAVSTLSEEAKRQQNAILGKTYLPYLSKVQ